MKKIINLIFTMLAMCSMGSTGSRKDGNGLPAGGMVEGWRHPDVHTRPGTV